MLQPQSHTQTQKLEWACEALTATGEPCDTAATAHCAACGKWFCAVHAEDEAWHRCALEPGDEGGEG